MSVWALSPRSRLQPLESGVGARLGPGQSTARVGSGAFRWCLLVVPIEFIDLHLIDEVDGIVVDDER